MLVAGEQTAARIELWFASSWVRRRMTGREGFNWKQNVRAHAYRSAGWLELIMYIIAYKDIIILPVSENMNNGKTHAYIEWAHSNALVPPIPASYQNMTSLSSLAHLSPYLDTSSSSASISSPFFPTAIDLSKERHRLFPSFASQKRGPPPSLAPHDPHPQHLAIQSNHSSHEQDWVRPQYVIKADDDAFVMLSELEARLRIEWYSALEDTVSLTSTPSHDTLEGWPLAITTAPNSQPTASPVRMGGGMTSHVLRRPPSTASVTQFWHPGGAMDDDGVRSIDPMVYWGCK